LKACKLNNLQAFYFPCNVPVFCNVKNAAL